jgi:CO/xanthine dehydrogenase Mo-binding subunit
MRGARVSDLQPRGLTRTSLLARPGVLAVVRGAGADPELLEPFVIVGADGGVMAFNGHVDLGTGIRTALAQIVAEELDVAFSAVTMILGDTALTPDQGPTIASETIQITAAPLRRAAAQARHTLVARAAHRLGVAAETLAVENGVVEGIGYAELVGNDTTWLALDEATPVKRVPVSISRRRRRVRWSMSTISGCRACCMAASCGRPMRASMWAPSSATR